MTVGMQAARDADFEHWREAMLKWQRECEQRVDLRDQFAAAALTGLLAQGDNGAFSEASYARAAYRWADAMLAERARCNETSA